MTNNAGLPEPVYRAICNDDYSPGDADYTTTQLIAPARIVALRRAHSGQMTEDAVDRIWSLWGQILHTLFERAAMGDELAEKRLSITFDGFKISGRVDLLHKSTLIDYKETKILHTNKPKEDWVMQGNINRLLCERSGFPITGIKYWARYRNWDKIQANHSSDYPPPMQMFDIPLWPLAQTEQFIRARIAAHESAKLELPMCSPEERWERPTRYALMQKGRKRAVKLYEDQDEAIEAVSGREGFFVETRPGESVRCLNYCPVVAYCSFGRALLEEKME